MEDRENVATKDLRWTEDEGSKINHTEKGGMKPVQNKRLALGVLSTNTSYNSQTRTKLSTLPITNGNNKKPTLCIVAGSCQAFKVYIDQDDENVPWPCMDMAVCSTEPTDIKKDSMNKNMNCKENISDLLDCSTTADADNSLPEYENEIHHYLKQAERKHRPKHDFMSRQPLINKSMRAILVDWLVEVAEEYRLVPETLYLTINYVDRFLSSNVIIDPSKLQLVGVACMLIASKIEEIYPPEVSEFVYITNSSYTGYEVRQMEKLVLKLLAFDLAVPTVLSFLDIYEKNVDFPGGMTQKCSFLTRYYCELSLQDSDVQWKYLPSAVATSSIVLALRTIGITSWFPRLEQNTGFGLIDLHACIDDMQQIVSRTANSNLQAIREKYGQPRFGSVATLMECKRISSQ